MSLPGSYILRITAIFLSLCCCLGVFSLHFVFFMYSSCSRSDRIVSLAFSSLVWFFVSWGCVVSFGFSACCLFCSSLGITFLCFYLLLCFFFFAMLCLVLLVASLVCSPVCVSALLPILSICIGSVFCFVVYVYMDVVLRFSLICWHMSWGIFCIPIFCFNVVFYIVFGSFLLFLLGFLLVVVFFGLVF